MKILICGFMGAGKSTFVSELVAPEWEKFELDDQIEGIAECSIAQIFEEQGETAFRQYEHQALEKLLLKPGNVLISLGGGALSDAVLKLIGHCGATLVWLNTPFEICHNRIDGDTNRPLVKQGRDKLLKLYQSRQKSYQQAQLQLRCEDTITLRNISDLLQRISDKS